MWTLMSPAHVVNHSVTLYMCNTVFWRVIICFWFITGSYKQRDNIMIMWQLQPGTHHGRRRRGGRDGSSRPTFCAIHFNTIILWHMHVRACARLVYKTHAKQLVLIQQVRWSTGMSASHSPAIGDKPIELLTITEWCAFGRGLIIFGCGLKFFIKRALRALNCHKALHS